MPLGSIASIDSDNSAPVHRSFAAMTFLCVLLAAKVFIDNFGSEVPSWISKSARLTATEQVTHEIIIKPAVFTD